MLVSVGYEWHGGGLQAQRRAADTRVAPWTGGTPAPAARELSSWTRMAGALYTTLPSAGSRRTPQRSASSL